MNRDTAFWQISHIITRAFAWLLIITAVALFVLLLVGIYTRSITWTKFWWAEGFVLFVFLVIWAVNYLQDTKA